MKGANERKQQDRGGRGRRRATTGRRPNARRSAAPRERDEAGARGGFLDGVSRALERGWREVKERAGTLVDSLDRSPTDALEMLKAQHTSVNELFAALEATEDPQRRRTLVTELAESLTIHATIEEEIFYPAVDTTGTEGLVQESYREHARMKRTLAALVALDPGDDELDAVLAHLKEEVLHHAKDEEEGKLFPRVERIIDADMREALGQEMLARIVELQQAGGLLAEAKNPAAAHAGAQA